MFRPSPYLSCPPCPPWAQTLSLLTPPDMPPAAPLHPTRPRLRCKSHVLGTRAPHPRPWHPPAAPPSDSQRGRSKTATRSPPPYRRTVSARIPSVTGKIQPVCHPAQSPTVLYRRRRRHPTTPDPQQMWPVDSAVSYFKYMTYTNLMKLLVRSSQPPSRRCSVPMRARVTSSPADGLRDGDASDTTRTIL